MEIIKYECTFFMIICPDWLIHLMNAVALIENEAELAYNNSMPRPFSCFTDGGDELWRTAVVWLTSRDERTCIHILTRPPHGGEKQVCAYT